MKTNFVLIGIIIGLFIGVSIEQVLGEGAGVPGAVQGVNLVVNMSRQYMNGLIVANGNALVLNGKMSIGNIDPIDVLTVTGKAQSDGLCIGTSCITNWDDLKTILGTGGIPGSTHNKLPPTGIRHWGPTGDSAGPVADYPRQDADYQRSFSFTKQGNWGVLDNITGLTWEMKTPQNMNDTFTWLDTKKYVDQVNATKLGGYSDWRMPTAKELEGLVDYGIDLNSTAVGAFDPTYFPNTAIDMFWTGTPDAGTPGYAWFVNFLQGANGRNVLSEALHVRLVRGTANPNQFVLTDNGLTVTDNSTGLMWKRDYEMRVPGQPALPGSRTPDWFTWSDSLKRSVTDRTAGYSDWRVPNVRELRSLIDDTVSSPAINKNFFPTTVPGAYFGTNSPTFDYRENAMVWAVTADYGNDVLLAPVQSATIRLVRDITTAPVSPPALTTHKLPPTGIKLWGMTGVQTETILQTTPQPDYPRQDADYQKPFDYTKIANDGSTLPATATLGTGAKDWACTKDNITGLIWEVKTTSGLRSKDNTYTWYQNGVGVAGDDSVLSGPGRVCQTIGRCDTEKFTVDVNQTTLCGFTDWRMPTIKELESIFDLGRNAPSINPDYFPNTSTASMANIRFYSSTPDVEYGLGQWAWGGDFSYGRNSKSQPMDPYAVRLVRGNPLPHNQFTITNNGLTVTDASTGLMWKRSYEMRDPANPGDWENRIDTFIWQEALQRAVADRTAGYSDWRLPNVKELRSIIDETLHDPAIDIGNTQRGYDAKGVFYPSDPNAIWFPRTQFQAWFWSSSPVSTLLYDQSLTFVVYFDQGMSLGIPRYYAQYVRLVRDITP